MAAYHLALNYTQETVSSGLAGLLISLGPVLRGDVTALPLVGWASVVYLSLLSTMSGYSMFYMMVETTSQQFR